MTFFYLFPVVSKLLQTLFSKCFTELVARSFLNPSHYGDLVYLQDNVRVHVSGTIWTYFWTFSHEHWNVHMKCHRLNLPTCTQTVERTSHWSVRGSYLSIWVFNSLAQRISEPPGFKSRLLLPLTSSRRHWRPVCWERKSGGAVKGSRLPKAAAQKWIGFVGFVGKDVECQIDLLRT